MERDRYGERQTRRDRHAEAEMGSIGRGRVAGPGVCGWRSELRGVGWQAGDPRERVAAASRVPNWKQLWAARLETQAQRLMTQLVVWGRSSFFSRKSQSLLLKPFN